MVQPVINTLIVAMIFSTMNIANATEVRCPGDDCPGAKPTESKKEDAYKADQKAEKKEEKKSTKDEGVKLKIPKEQTPKKDGQKFKYR